MNKTKQLALLTAVAIFAVLAGGWFLLVSPQRSHASDVRTETATQVEDNQRLQSRIQSLLSQHKDLPQVQAQLAKLATQLPSNPGLPSLIRQLTTAADNAGVDLLSLTPSAPVAVGGAATATATAQPPNTQGPGGAAPAAATGQLSAVPINIIVVGGFFQIEQFLSNVESLSRSFLTTALDVCPGKLSPDNTVQCVDTVTSPGDYQGLSMGSVTGKVFMNVKPAAPATPVAPTAAK